MQPCTGCGRCCASRICRIGAMRFGHYTLPCPALRWDGQRYRCGLYEQDPDRYEAVLEIGRGCCLGANESLTRE
uniref:4Fe-4S ferredoxin-type domain-containing protein n=1 Tax=Desulfomonile tiedjei TaxID=2358 RepID=A0A7C4ATV5_9BACT